MVKDQMLKCYRTAVKNNVKLFDMSPVEMAGYYMTCYPGNPEGAVTYDVENLVIPVTKGNAAKQCIRCCY